MAIEDIEFTITHFNSSSSTITSRTGEQSSITNTTNTKYGYLYKRDG
jgi:hypothetical protein